MTVTSRDVQVRVVFCDWLAWLLRMKKPAALYEVSLESVHQVKNHAANDLCTFNSNDDHDASSAHRTHLACSEVCRRCYSEILPH